jgi:plastocyanin
MRRQTRSVVVIATLALLVLAGCSSSDDESSESSVSTVPAGVNLTGKVNIHGSSTAKEGLEVELDNFYFGPTFIKASANQKFKVELKNEGTVPHTFTSDTLGVNETLQPDQTKTIELNAPPTGFSAWYCNFHRGQGMQGAVFVA